MSGIKGTCSGLPAISKPLAKLAAAANREHQKAGALAADAVEHAVRAGEARDLCDAGQWSAFVDAHFQGSLRTAQKYIRLARHWRMLARSGPAGALSSQEQAAKAITAIVRGDGGQPEPSNSPRTRRARGASNQNPSALAGEALEILRSVERQFFEHQSAGYHVRAAADFLRNAIARLSARAGVATATDSATADGATSSPATPPEAINGGFDDVVG